MGKNGDPMQGKNDFRTDHKGTEEILKREKKIFQYKRANAELQTRLGEESAIRKIIPYIILLMGFIALQFMENWMGYYMDISGQDYVPLLIIFVILLIHRYLKDRKRQVLREQMKANRQKCDQLQQEIDEIRREMQ